jgi:hypothetical protein
MSNLDAGPKHAIPLAAAVMISAEGIDASPHEVGESGVVITGPATRVEVEVLRTAKPEVVRVNVDVIPAAQGVPIRVHVDVIPATQRVPGVGPRPAAAHAAVAAQPGMVSESMPTSILVAETADHSANLPEWTRRYPQPARPVLAKAGLPPAEFPRAHELNVAITEVVVAFENCADSCDEEPRARNEWFFWRAVEAARNRVQVTWPLLTPATDLIVLDGGRVALPPPRNSAEFEPAADWWRNYPSQYETILRKHGLPAVANSRSDQFNRRLIGRLPPDCIDEKVIEDVKDDALGHSFGSDLSWKHDSGFDDGRGPEMELAEFDIPDESWLSDYPSEHRALLRGLAAPISNMRLPPCSTAPSSARRASCAMASLAINLSWSICGARSGRSSLNSTCEACRAFR